MKRQKRNNLSFSDFGIILILVIGVGWLTLDELLVVPNNQAPNNQWLNGARLPASSGQQTNSNISSSMSSDLTELSSVYGNVENRRNSTETIEFFCSAKKNTKPIKTQASQIRIFSKSCLQEKIIQVKNQTNGSTAVIFPVKQKEFTTDFFDLVEGENHIEIKFKKPVGGEESITLVLIRSDDYAPR